MTTPTPPRDVLVQVVAEMRNCDPTILTRDDTDDWADRIERALAGQGEVERDGWHDIYDESAMMPELNQEVLVFVPGEGVRFDVWREWKEQPAGPLVGGWVTCGPDFTENDGVTHWMPLPEQPR